MPEIISVKLRGDGRAYSFDPAGGKFSPGDKVVVGTAKGLALGTVSKGNHEDDAPGREVKPVLRAASEEDIRADEQNRVKEAEALNVFRERIEKYRLPMLPVDAEYTLDGTRLQFRFTSDERVDFRALVRDLGATFHTRIELRQIGVRDETRVLGGLGTCGQPFCCSRFLHNFEPVTVKMAKEQGLAVNPAKISGACGRLMCCLAYEKDVYAELIALTPKVGSLVSTPRGEGTVTDRNLVSGMLSVRLTGSEGPPVQVHRDSVTVLRSGKAPASEQKKPARGKPSGSKPPQGKSPGGKPSGGKPSQGKFPQGKSFENKSSGSNPTECKPSGSNPPEGKPTVDRLSVDKQPEGNPSVDKLSGSDPSEDKPTGGRQFESKPSQGKPSESDPPEGKR